MLVSRKIFTLVCTRLETHQLRTNVMSEFIPLPPQQCLELIHHLVDFINICMKFQVMRYSSLNHGYKSLLTTPERRNMSGYPSA